MMHSQDHHPSPQEEEGFEKGVGHKMEDSRRPGPHPQRQKHIANLADGRVSQHPLDIPLGQGAEPGQEQRHSADEGYNYHDHRGQAKEAMHTGDEINACSNHRGRVDESTNRRGTGHGVGQPGLQGQLGRFADRAPQKQGCGGHSQARAGGPLLHCPPHQFLNIQCSQMHKEQEETNSHSGIPHSRHNKRFPRRSTIARLAIPKTDEEVAAQPYALPAQV